MPIISISEGEHMLLVFSHI